ncbi:MAG: PhzF family phenazine biosynthesis protein [Paraglaciecola sp.]|jgi:PhzF family phenazine biosynthesis protein
MTTLTTESNTLNRLSAFTDNPDGGNPAAVWIGDKLPQPKIMQQIATQVGYSETAFIAPRMGNKRHVRYFSPKAEVPFCGHATIASGVALGEANGDNTYFLNTAVGEIPVTVRTENGVKTASLISVSPQYEPALETLLSDALNALGWSLEELDFSIPPARAFAGNWHLVIAVKLKSRLDNLQYDFDKLKTLMLDDDLTTLQLIWRENAEVIHSRNPFPVGGVIEDPATGAAAAALGGYLREAKLVSAPSKFIIRQGEVMGRPSLLKLEIPTTGGIIVSGTAVQLVEAK